ncbi:MAG TPA: hypothetical protein VH951_11115 [Dehalococcoidia bacterium]
MTAIETLAPYRKEFAEALADLMRKRAAAQSALVAAHVRAADDDTIGAPLCLALADALGVAAPERRAPALAAGLVELAASAAESLTHEDGASNGVALDSGYPLALNSVDALYSLAQLALADMAEDLEGLERVATGSTDFLTLALWRVLAEPAAGSTTEAIGRLAGANAAIAARLDQAAISEVAEFGARAARQLAGDGASVSGSGLGLEHLSPTQREKVAAILR